MSYSLKDIDEAERRIRAECPTALINRFNYDWSLSVARGDRSVAFIVFDDRKGDGPTIVGDLDRIIAELNKS